MLSIIVPVYNAQAYIDPCIESVLSQSFRDFELILVDDGSTDDSLKKCRRWETDPRVRITSTENHGVSHARNLGLQQASGTWILFLDSDDYLLEGSLEHLTAIVSPDTRLVIGSYTDVAAKAVTPLHKTVIADAVRTMTLDPINHRLMPDFYAVKPMSLCACWGKLYRSDVIRENDLRFHEELRLSEDTLFNLDYLACIDHAVVTNLPVTYYRQNPVSVTRVFNAKHLSNRFRYFDMLRERTYPEAPAHILSLLFFELCRIEGSAAKHSRKALEQEIIGYLSEHADLLQSTKNQSLSTGKWQRMVYMAAAACFRHSAYQTGFAVLRAYSAAAQRKTEWTTTNE